MERSRLLSKERWNILKLVHLGQYIQGESSIHRMNPLIKLLLLILFSLFLVLRISAFTHIFGFFFAFFFLFVSKVGLWRGFKLLKGIWIFLVMVIAMHIVFTGGAGYDLVFFRISHEGLKRGIVFSLRLYEMLLFASIFGWTTKPSELASSLEQTLSFLINLGIRDVCTSLLITMRFIPEVFSDIGRIRMAQKARGLTIEGSIKKKIMSVIPLVIPLFIRAFRRADSISCALELKGYHSKGDRTHLVPLFPAISDYLALIVIIMILIVVWCIDQYLTLIF